eukprot:SAG11_NODE_3892_length_2163_cov_0.859981_2_plen_174_part_00
MGFPHQNMAGVHRAGPVHAPSNAVGVRRSTSRQASRPPRRHTRCAGALRPRRTTPASSAHRAQDNFYFNLQPADEVVCACSHPVAALRLERRVNFGVGLPSPFAACPRRLPARAPLLLRRRPSHPTSCRLSCSTLRRLRLRHGFCVLQVTMWVAMEKVDAENGALSYLPGSHR